MHRTISGITMLLLALMAASCSARDAPERRTGRQSPADTPAAARPKMVRTRGLTTGNVICELQDSQGNIWFSTGGEGAYRYDGRAFTNFTTDDGLCDDHVSSIVEDNNGHILFGTRKGICRYDGRTIDAYSSNPALRNMSVSSLLQDRDGNLWIGTMDSGVYRFDGEALRNFLNKGDQPFNDGRRSQSIIDMIQDRAGNIWLCSWNRGGIWRFDGTSFTNFLPAAATASIPYLGSNPPQAGISDDMVFSVTEDKKGNLWFATRRQGACRYDGKEFTVFRESEGFVSRGVYSIAEDAAGNIWLTTNDYGVWRYDGTAFRNFTTRDGLVSNSVFSVLADRNGKLWFGTRGFGLSRYDGKTFITLSE